MLPAEFLKDATMRPYGRAKNFRDCARFWLLNAKKHNLPLFYLFWVIFQFFCWFLPILFAQNFRTEILVAQKKLLLESLPFTWTTVRTHLEVNRALTTGRLQLETVECRIVQLKTVLDRTAEVLNMGQGRVQ